MILWLKGGKIVDPVKGIVERADVIIERGRISNMLPPDKFEVRGKDLKVLDATGKLVIPGLVDMHVHLREPGEEYKETVASGVQSAIAGGFTAVACMPNTDPPNDNRSVTEFILEQAERAGTARVYPVAAITKGQKGARLCEFGDLRSAGAVAVSDDGLPVMDSEVMRRALEYANYHGMLCISHCEDVSLSRGGQMNEGRVSTEMGLAGIPATSEEIMVYREISLARLTGCPVHIAHVSSAESVKLIERAKSENLPVTAETAPHYFSLDQSAVIGYNTNAKVNPPLRSEKDVEAIKQGLATGVIDVIASDHAPHTSLEKDVEFDKAAFGLIGLETSLPLTLRLVQQGVLGLTEAIAKMTCNPASLLGIGSGRLEKGARADLAVLDPEKEFIYTEEDVVSKSKNSPFLGKNLRGKIELTIINGKIVFWYKDAGYTGC